MKKSLEAICLAALPVVVMAPALATEWLGGGELETSCEALLSEQGNNAGELCVAYMQGFIAGADAADTKGSRAARKAVKAEEGDESFTERAARTRLGTLRMLRLRTMNQATYCIDESVPALRIVEEVASYLEEHPETLKLTNREAVHEALVNGFPCDS